MANKRPDGDGLVRKRSDGRWEGRIVVGHKEDGAPIFRSVFAHTQKEVMRKLHSQIETYRDVELTEESNMTLGEWLDKWLDNYMALTIRESTMDSYKTMTKHYIKPYLGGEKIGSITTADIQQLYNWLRENGRVNEHYEKGNALSDSMVRSIHMMLHQAIDAAVRERLIVKNPTEGTVIPKNNYPPKQILTEEQLEVSPFDLSGGQKRRVAIAGVIAMEPEVLILDEPTAGLDPKAHQDVLDMVVKIHEHEKNIIILVSHNMNDIAKLADKVLVMDGGKLAMQGTPEEVFAQHVKLAEIGLALPHSAELMRMAAEKGLPFDGNFLTLDDIEEEIYNYLKKD